MPSIPDYFETRLADGDGQIEDYGYALEDDRGIHLIYYRGSAMFRILKKSKKSKKNEYGT